MAITFELPADVERELQRQVGDLGRAAKEAFIIENYRAGLLSIGDVAELLGFETRFEAEQWLGRRGVRMNYSVEDLEADRRTLDRVLGPVQP